jgi:hypothetical protein
MSVFSGVTDCGVLGCKFEKAASKTFALAKCQNVGRCREECCPPFQSLSFFDLAMLLVIGVVP